jgi:ZIP family zinc transporter
MLAAAVLGLIIPSLEYGEEMVGWPAIIITVAGIFLGALVISLLDKLVPHLHSPDGDENEEHTGNDMIDKALLNAKHNDERVNKVLLFVLAIAIHNLPEGIAAGVGFGSGNNSEALMIALGIALQNIPEGMVIIAPMLSAGVSPKKTFLYASLTGLVEVIGTFLGYFAVHIASTILPFALAFAGGTMLYVISDEMIPETHEHGYQRAATYSLLVGFAVMLVMDFFL